jgi:hypothetical protein
LTQFSKTAPLFGGGAMPGRCNPISKITRPGAFDNSHRHQNAKDFEIAAAKQSIEELNGTANGTAKSRRRLNPDGPLKHPLPALVENQSSKPTSGNTNFESWGCHSSQTSLS